MIIKMAENYIYAVARIRALETSLFSSSVIEQLISCKTYDQCLQLLKEKGWGGADTDNDAEAILKYETDKTWKTVLELSLIHISEPTRPITTSRMPSSA